jgi:uncharacterized membrane protein
MTGSLAAVFWSVLAFVGGHFLLSWQPLRSRVVAGIGEGTFTALYTLLMVVFIVWVVAAYRAAPVHALYFLGAGANWVPILFMPFASMLAVTGLLSKNPTAVMGERMLEQRAQPAGIATVTRHPFLAGAALWALSHLVANGDAASVLLFGGFAVLSIGGMSAIDHKRRLRLGAKWETFAASTSRLPFAAAFGGRMPVDWNGIGWLRPAAGLVLYAVLYAVHDRLFGAPIVLS